MICYLNVDNNADQDDTIEFQKIVEICNKVNEWYDKYIINMFDIGRIGQVITVEYNQSDPLEFWEMIAKQIGLIGINSFTQNYYNAGVGELDMIWYCAKVDDNDETITFIGGSSLYDYLGEIKRIRGALEKYLYDNFDHAMVQRILNEEM